MAINDNKDIKDLEHQLTQMKLLLASPFANLVPNGEELRKFIAETELEMRILSELPDRFNDRFATLGWIAFEQMNADVMSKAIVAFDTEGIEAAEELLEAYWQDRNMVKLWARGLFRFETVKHRRKLIDLAIEDHFAGRYHASVPVILSQIDGIVHDLSNTSFYKKPGKTDHLLVPNTIAGAASGLPFLAGLMSEKRDTTLKEPTNLPYRHGIQHGRDLSYDNRRTSTKAIVALLALTAWVKAIHDDESFQPPRIEEHFKKATTGPSKFTDVPSMMESQYDFRDSYEYTASANPPPVGTLVSSGQIRNRKSRSLSQSKNTCSRNLPIVHTYHDSGDHRYSTSQRIQSAN